MIHLVCVLEMHGNAIEGAQCSLSFVTRPAASVPYQIAMYNARRMKTLESSHDLVHEQLYMRRGESLGLGVHPLERCRHELEHEVSVTRPRGPTFARVCEVR